MTQVPQKLLTPAAYARHRGVSRPAVVKALHAGRITLTPEGLIDPIAADAQWLANTRPRITPKHTTEATEAGEISYAEARRRQAVADMLMSERLEAEQRGELLRHATMERIVGNLASGLRQRVMGVTARLAPLLAAESNVTKVSAMLDAELRQALAAGLPPQ